MQSANTRPLFTNCQNHVTVIRKKCDIIELWQFAVKTKPRILATLLGYWSSEYDLFANFVPQSAKKENQIEI
jgi:hypothetical protein